MAKEKSLVIRAENAFKKTEKIKDILREANQKWYEAAAYIFEIRESGGFKDMGCENFPDYCEEYLQYGYKTIMQLVRAYEVTVLKFGYKDIASLPDPSKLYLVSEMIEREPDRIEEFIALAKNSPINDIRAIKREAKHGVGKYDCPHEGSEVVVMSLCPKCGLTRLYPDSHGVFVDSHGNAYKLIKGRANKNTETQDGEE